MKSISFTVPGLPKGQPRAKAVAFGGRARVYDPGTANTWKASIIEACQTAMREANIGAPFIGPVELRVSMYFPRPKSHFLRGQLRDIAPQYVSKKPDTDNCLKALQDALNATGIWHDDAQAAAVHVTKKYASNQPLSIIGISQIEP